MARRQSWAPGWLAPFSRASSGALLGLALGVGLGFGAASPGGAQVVLNEVMYHPVEEPGFTGEGLPLLDLNEDPHEYVELLNAGGQAVDLSRWRLDGGIQFTFPDGVSLAGGGYLVVAKDPARLAAIPEYGLTVAGLHGPYTGQLSNNGETIQLRDAAGQIADTLSYSDGFPWPGSADALGASQRWTGIDPLLLQYRGRSLERVSAVQSGQDPANWRASPWPGEPSPGRPNAVRRSVPLPVVVQQQLEQLADGQSVIRSNQPARLELKFSATNELGPVRVEYYVDELNRTNETSISVEMSGSPPEFAATLPGFGVRAVVRYRVWAFRQPSEGPGYEEVVLPRSDDPFGWMAYFVTPQRRSTNAAVYDLLISSNSLFRLSANLRDNPLNGYNPPLGTAPNGHWNLTEPAILACDGVVYDVQVRHSGSFWRRDPGAKKFKIDFPTFRRLNDHATLLVLDKDSVNAFAYLVYAEAGLPAARTRWVDLYFNNNAPLTRLEFEEHDDRLLERYHEEQTLINPGQPLEPIGRIFKSSGIGNNVGPYGNADGRALQTNQGWTPLQRYEWNYTSKTKDWEGFVPLQQLCEQLAAARGPGPDVDIPTLRAWLEANWDVDAMLTYLSIRGWMVAVDDTYHNFYVWRRANGRWTMLGWDFDNEMNPGNTNITIFNGEGGNVFKDSFYKAFREEYKQRLYWLNNTLLDPESLATLGITPPELGPFGPARQKNVNAQLGFGPFHKPLRPTALTPAGGESVLTPARLLASPYAHTLDPAPAHVSTVWQIRHADGTYRFPVYAVTSTVNVTSLPIPFALLEPGQLYFWRCVYQDADGHPSVAAQEASFRYGGSYQRVDVVTLGADVRWKFNSSGTNLGTAWRAADYDDRAWPEGPPLLGVSSASLPAAIRTPLPLSHLTYYFRHRFSFPGGAARTSLRLRHVIDDGAVFYLNGVEFLRYNLSTFYPLGSIPYTAPANQEIGDAAYGQPIALSLTNLLAGDNVLAVEVHQRSTNSQDLVFGLSLDATFEAESGGVRFNELMAFNRSAVAHGTAYPDWIELHNPTDHPQSLAGLSLTDNALTPLQYLFPSGTLLPPRGFLVVWCDTDTSQPGLHTGFNLRAEGETIWLLGALSNKLVQLDQLTYGLQLADRSVGRFPDGTGPWALTIPTPDGGNQPHPLGSERALRINEWMASPTAGPDWFELFNPELLPVAIGGLFLTDDLAIPTNSTIHPLSFLDGWSFHPFLADNNPAAGADHVNFALRTSGEAIGLFDAAGTAIDTVTFGAQSSGISQGRLPDGGANMIHLLTGATPGRSNAGDADNDGMPDGWEQDHNLNPLLSSDAGADLDSDGQSNFQEFLVGSDPHVADDCLRVEAVEWIPRQDNSVRLRFQLRPGKVYECQYRDTASNGSWQSLAIVGPEANGRLVEILDSNRDSSASRFYRLVLRRG